MEWETYIKAQDMVSSMDYLRELEGVIGNSTTKSNRSLATIEIEEYEDARRIVVKKCRVINHVTLSEEFKDKFLKLINEEHRRLTGEFKKL